jgi:hypothetical protein
MSFVFRICALLSGFTKGASAEGATTLNIDTSRILAMTRDEYVSWNLDSSTNRDFFERNLANPQLAAFAKEISPAYMRVGGTGAKCLYYQVGDDKHKTHPGEISWHWPDPKKGPHGFSMDPHYLTEDRWDAVNRLAADSGAKLIFNMNEAVFVEDGGSNLGSLLRYSQKMEYRIEAIEVSNEQGEPSPATLKAVYKLLRDFYPDDGSRGPRPGLVAPDEASQNGMVRARANAVAAGVPLMAVTYHDYNDGHRYSNCEGATKPFIAPNSSNFYSTVGETWMGEAATCGQGGKVGVADSFASGLWYWQYLGRLAQLNHKIFMRQTLVGGNYGLLRDRFWDKTMKGDTLQPNADYFSAVLFTKLMGKEVLLTSTPDDEVQVYAHCARPGQAGFQEGALAVALINLDTQRREVQLSAHGLSTTSRRLEYIMTAASKPPSQFAKINGDKVLKSLADLVGVEGQGDSFTLPPQSYGAVLFPDAAVHHCVAGPSPPPLPPSPPSPTPTPPTPPSPPAPPGPTPPSPPAPPSPSGCGACKACLSDQGRCQTGARAPKTKASCESKGHTWCGPKGAEFIV